MDLPAPPLGASRQLGGGVCRQRPRCPDALAADRIAARAVARHPEQGWSLLCNGVVLLTTAGRCFLAAGPSLLPAPIWSRPPEHSGASRDYPGSAEAAVRGAWPSGPPG